MVEIECYKDITTKRSYTAPLINFMLSPKFSLNKIPRYCITIDVCVV